MSDPVLNEQGMTELHLGAYHGELDWVQKCTSDGLNVNARDGSGMTPLHWVADMGLVGISSEREKIVRVLLQHGANVNAKDNADVSVLARAVLAGNEDIVKIIIAAGADLNSIDQRGDTPLDIALSH
ncbi:MAG: ankyrin repeat domain-containing protein, partial [Chitinophagaceae bacterium]